MKKYKDPEVLTELYNNQGLTQKEIAENLGVSRSTIKRWIKKHGIGNKKPEYRDAEVLNKLYHEKEMSQQDIADKFGVSRVTIHKWMKKNDVERRKPPNERPPCYKEESRGYRVWQHYDGEKNRTVHVHRLLAVSKFGVEAVSDKVVHHKNECKFDNRPDNIEVMSQSEHMKLHRRRESNS